MQTATDPRFLLDFSDRLALAQRRSGLSVSELAERIEVHRNTVGAWINGRQRPRSRDLKAYALATGYPVRWLETGEAPHDGGAPDGGSLPGLDSNQEPIG
ncbi:MAG: hypothetical protein K0R01_165 [Mycobacterium sp.]|nr:hypothetical protein [Mycobacterium sp.]